MALDEEKKEKLFELLRSNQLPYCIAMFVYLGFIKQITKRFKVKDTMFKKIGTWFNVNYRQVKGNINVLNEGSNEDTERYTSHDFKYKVKEDYLNLK
jgi:hypothetical protein